MLSATFLMALGSVTNALLLVVGLYIYVSLIRQISGRRSTSPNGSTAGFGLPEAILAAGLTFLLLLGVLVSVSKPSVQFSGRVLVENLLFTLGIVLVVVAFLRLRGFDLNLLGGFSQTSFLRALSTGTILMLAAYPLIALADAITQQLAASGYELTRSYLINQRQSTSIRQAYVNARLARSVLRTPDPDVPTILASLQTSSGSVARPSMRAAISA